jgi:predicted transcriptional regulator
MTALTIRLPTSVHRKVKELALREEISLNQFIASAVAEKMASVFTLDYLKTEAAEGCRADFEQFLSMVSEVPVDEADR